MGVIRKGENWFIDYRARGRRIREKIGPSKRLAESVLAKRKLELAENKFLDVRSLRLGHETRLLYLAGWPGGVETLLRLADKHGNGGGWRVFVAGLKEFRESGGRCAFVNRSQYDPRQIRLAPAAPSAPAAAEVR